MKRVRGFPLNVDNPVILPILGHHGLHTQANILLRFAIVRPLCTDTSLNLRRYSYAGIVRSLMHFAVKNLVREPLSICIANVLVALFI